MERSQIGQEAKKVDKLIKEVDKYEKLGDDVDKSPAQVSKHCSKKGQSYKFGLDSYGKKS